MPTYEYACKSCGDRLEVVQSFHDAPLTECPSCGGELRKVFHAIGISFKGDGFYKTDSRKPAPSSSSSSSSKDASSGDSGGSSGDTATSKPVKDSSTASSSSSSSGSDKASQSAAS